MFGVTGPYFFDENNQGITVDCESYFTTMQTFLIEKL
jgi:hypothetical protein